MTMIIDGTNGLTFNNATTQASAGVILQVVNATYATQTSNSSTSPADTGLTATITPLFSTSKILVIVDQNGCYNAGTAAGLSLSLLRNSTFLINFGTRVGGDSTATTLSVGSASASYLDSPATTSAVSYKTQFLSVSNTSSVLVQVYNCTSTITLMEIKA